MEKSAVVLKREISEAETKIADLKRQAEAKTTIAEEIRMATSALAEAERVKRVVGLRLDELDEQLSGLNVVAERPILPNSDFSRVARGKSIEVGHEIEKMSLAQDAASTELAKCQDQLAVLQKRRDAVPEYAAFLERKRNFTDVFEKLFAEAVSAATTTRNLLNRLDGICREDQILLYSSHSDFVGRGLVSADTLHPSSQLQLRCSELRAKFQRDLD